MSLPKFSAPVLLGLGLAIGLLLVMVLPHAWLFRDATPPRAAGAAGDEGWACPMFCVIADGPGLCPVCGMDLEPVTDHGGVVPLRADERRMAGIRTEQALRQDAVLRIDAVGTIRPDERREGLITAWVGGRLDALTVDFTGTRVEKGSQIGEIYAPELLAAQEELLSAARSVETLAEAAPERRETARSVLTSVRRRLELLGVPGATLDAILEAGEARTHLPLFANVGGTVLEKRVEVGEYVNKGDVLYRVVDLERVWAILEVWERDAGAVAVGQPVHVRLQSLPGEVHEGVVAFVDPVLDEQRRVVRVRVDLENEDGRLKPGAFATAEILVDLTQEKQLVLIPWDAVLDGGRRKLVYVLDQEPEFDDQGNERWPAIYAPREVELGHRIGDQVVVLRGVLHGEEVVTRGQFLIDSQLQLTGKPSLFVPQASMSED